MPSTKALPPKNYVDDASKVTAEDLLTENDSLPLSMDELNADSSFIPPEDFVPTNVEPNVDFAKAPSESFDVSTEEIPETDPSVPVEFLTEETVAPVNEPVLTEPEASVEPKVEPKVETQSKSNSENRVYDYTDAEYKSLVKSGDLLSATEFSKIQKTIDARVHARRAEPETSRFYLGPDEKDREGGKFYEEFSAATGEDYYISDETYTKWLNTRKYKFTLGKYNTVHDIMNDPEDLLDTLPDDIDPDEERIQEYLDKMLELSGGRTSYDMFVKDRRDEIRANQRDYIFNILSEGEKADRARKDFSREDREFESSKRKLELSIATKAFNDFTRDKYSDIYADQMMMLFNDEEFDKTVKDYCGKHKIKDCNTEKYKRVVKTVDDAFNEHAKDLDFLDYDHMDILGEAHDKFNERLSAENNYTPPETSKSSKKSVSDKVKVPKLTNDEKRKASCGLLGIVGGSVIIGVAIRGTRDQKLLKDLKEKDKELKKADAKLREKLQSPKTFGDAFADAFAKIMNEQSREELEKRAEKIEKRVEKRKAILHRASQFLGVARSMASLQSDQAVANHFRGEREANQASADEACDTENNKAAHTEVVKNKNKSPRTGASVSGSSSPEVTGKNLDGLDLDSI